MKASARGPFFWLVLLLLGAECLLRWALPYRLVPNAGEAIRNPLSYRGWPEYLDTPDQGRPLVVLISHSQGVGEEISDPSTIYAARLRAHLAARDIGFENWSCHGLGLIELDLLTMRALKRGADLLLLVLATRHFRQPDTEEIAPLSDISLTAGDPSQWPRLPGSLTMLRLDLDDVLERSVSLHSALARSRIALFDWAAESVPLRWHEVLLGHERDGYGPRLDRFAAGGGSLLVPARDVNDAERSTRQARRIGVVPEPRRRSNETQFPAIYRKLAAHLQGTDTRWAWVWCPIDPARPQGRRHSDPAFIAAAIREIEHSGHPSHDLSDALDSSSFTTQFHFTEEGHAELARLLKQIIDDEL